MREIISLKTHNILDYVGGTALLLSPYIFGFSEISVARNTFLLLGIALVAYSLLTNYRYSIAKIIPLGVHMTLDVLLGVFTMLAPWVLDYSYTLTSFQIGVHLVLGVGVLGLVAFTQPRTERERIGELTDRTIDIRRAA